MIIDKIINTILQSTKISITNHVSPDGDALGSALGLYSILKSLNKKVEVIALEKPPVNLEFLPGYDNVVVSEEEISTDVDCVIVLDCANVERVNANINFSDGTYKIINIDHHMSNDNYGYINYVDTSSPAVGQIIFHILERLNVELTKEIATCLYTSLLTDTGSFRYPGTSKETHRIAGALISTGINFTKIHEMIFDSKSYEKIKLYGKVIDTIKLELHNKVCFMDLYDEFIKELSLENEDVGDVISFGTKIKDVEVTVFIKEKNNLLKISMRSKEVVDVRKIAEIYGGGGHTRAAGFSTEKSRDEIKEELIKIISEELIG